MTTYVLEFHEFAQLFPLIGGDEYQGLLQDIDANGQRAPIVLYDNKILDGRNRYRVCADLLIEPRFEEYVGEDALGYVLSLNLYRRQLSVAQRALIAAELSSLRGGSAITFDLGKAGEPDTEATKMAIEAAAKVLGISARSVSSACKVFRDGTPELLYAVKSGVVSVSAAEQVAKLEKEEQQELCTRGPKAIRKVAKEMREEGGKAKTKTPAVTAVKDVLPPPVPIDDDDDDEQGIDTHVGQMVGVPEEPELTFTVPEKKPTALLLFELADLGMNEGREAESVAAEIMDAVEDGLDLQLLAFAAEVVLKVRDRVRAKMYAR